jgi:hypothetical protein
MGTMDKEIPSSPDRASDSGQVRHEGIFCDLCTNDSLQSPSCIRGDRYRCTMCVDTDFCERCEADPSNTHDKSHPLIKIKTPIPQCNVNVMVDQTIGIDTPTESGNASQPLSTYRGKTRKDQGRNMFLVLTIKEPVRTLPAIDRADSTKSLFRGSVSFRGECTNKHLVRMWKMDPREKNILWGYRLQPSRGKWKDYRPYAHNGELSFLDIIQDFCISLQVEECCNTGCAAIKEKLEKVAPACEWEPFRSWSLVFLSCQANKLRENGPPTTPYMDRIYPGPFAGMVDLGLFKAREGIDSGMVCDLIYWALLFVYEQDYGPDLYHPAIEAWWRPSFLSKELTIQRNQKAFEKAQLEKICPNRLWNIVRVSQREHDVLPALMELGFPHSMQNVQGSLEHKGHDRCSAEFCQFANDDNTLQPQPHKCSSSQREECRQVTFEISQLNELALDNKATAWTLDDPPRIYEKDYERTVKLQEGKEHYERNSIKAAARKESRSYRNIGYMAISHIWSDGTGSGRNPGSVNSCLFNWFREIAEELECDGIWWDAICIPNDRIARRAAINKMHEYYAGAKCTIVHDRYLLDFEWAEDGSPCLALVLSPWFSRGWTALELNMSDRVKVLFKNPAYPKTSDKSYVIKDLIEDILPTSYATQGHKYAAAIIMRVMNNLQTVNDIISILKTRSTSWTRDRIIIAALLIAGLTLDSALTETQITCAIVSNTGELNPSFLLHGHGTVKDHGKFSWCPSSLFDGEVPMRETKLESDSNLWVTRPKSPSVELVGEITGTFKYRVIRETDVDHLLPFCFHPSIEWRIKIALSNWNTCLLLRHPKTPESSPSVLVTVLGTGFIDGGMPGTPWSDEWAVLDCEFVGAVSDDGLGVYSEKKDEISVRLGTEQKYPNNESAEELVNEYRALRTMRPWNNGPRRKWRYELEDWLEMKEDRKSGNRRDVPASGSNVSSVGTGSPVSLQDG